MDDLEMYWSRNEKLLSELVVRVSELETVVAKVNGVSLQSDASKLPTVVFENSPQFPEVINNGDN